MFLVETRRNSSPAAQGLGGLLRCDSEDQADLYGKSPRSDSPPIAKSSLLDRQTLLLSAVASHRSRETTPLRKFSNNSQKSNSASCRHTDSKDCCLSHDASADHTSDCVSPAVCKKLLSLSEDMNLLVRNITKEAKTLVQAEM